MVNRVHLPIVTDDEVLFYVGGEERHLKEIFKYGFSTKTSRRSRGVGLSFVKHVVDSHMGMIKAENARGKGAKFTILFPTVS